MLFVGGQSVPNFDINTDTSWPCHKLTPYLFDCYYENTKYNNLVKRKCPLPENLLDLHTWCIPISRFTSGYIITPKGAQTLIKLIFHNKHEFISSPLNSFICSNGRSGNLSIYELLPHITYSSSATSSIRHLKYNDNIFNHIGLSFQIVKHNEINNKCLEIINKYKLKLHVTDNPDLFIFIDPSMNLNIDTITNNYNSKLIIYITPKHRDNIDKNIFLKYINNFDFISDLEEFAKRLVTIVMGAKTLYYKNKISMLI